MFYNLNGMIIYDSPKEVARNVTAKNSPGF